MKAGTAYDGRAGRGRGSGVTLREGGATVTEYDEPGRLRYLAGAVRRARRLRGLSGRELARRAGLSETLVSKIEAGRTSPAWVTMDRIASALGVPGGWFVGRETEEVRRAEDR